MEQKSPSRIQKIKDWYFKYERPLSSVSLVGGFIFDAFTLRRVDELFENVWTALHLLTAGLGILLLNYFENKHLNKQQDLSFKDTRLHFWLLIFIQFSFGGLLSTFLVFYFRSATIAASWPFMLLLVIVFICNESFREHYARLTFQISVLFLSLFSFCIFIIPVVVHQIGDSVFILSGVVSLVVTGLFLGLLRYTTQEKFIQSWKPIAISIAALFIGINILYFTNLIPPIPLSLKSGGVYHAVSRTASGDYQLVGEPSGGVLNFFEREQVQVVAGKPLYVFSAIFSPTNLNTSIFHQWQYYNETTKTWETVSKINLSVIGGRDNGYRTYSLKNNVLPGRWRVDVENGRGQVIGRISFTVTQASSDPVLETHVE